MSASPPLQIADRDCLLAWARERQLESLLPLARRYGALVYASAYRRTGGNDAQAKEVTSAVFAVLTRRARKLPARTVIPAWLFNISQLAVRKHLPWRIWPWRWFNRARGRDESPNDAAWSRIAPTFDNALSRLPRKQREAFLFRHVLDVGLLETSGILRTTVARTQGRAERALKALTKRYRKAGCADRETFLREVSEHALPPLSEDVTAGLAQAMAEAATRRPRQKLARAVLSSLGLKRWRRRLFVGATSALVAAVIVGSIIWRIESKSGFSRSIALFLEWRVRWDGLAVRGLTVPAKSWPADDQTPRPSAAHARSAVDIYRTTNIWQAHLVFSREAWSDIEPRRIAPLPHFIQPNGSLLLRNPKAQRSGLAGVIGVDFHWSHAGLEFGQATFTNVAARFKGNGSHLLSLYGDKRAFKVDLNRYVKGQKLAGGSELVFNNLIADSSFLSDTLGYEFFREAGVPASRTAFAYLSLSVQGKWERKPLGLYVMVEPIDSRFAAEQFGTRNVPIFKPVTYQLFEWLGPDWSAYAEVYDVKTETTPEQQRRLIDFADLVSHSSDEEFAERVGDFLDLGAFARFLAGQVMLSNYDSLLFDGQNYYLYLDPSSRRFGFIPWDLDSCWGGFPLWLTEERERASIWHPWTGENLFLERVMAADAFQKLYRASLEEFLAKLFVPSRLFRRIDELAQVVRPAVAAESDYRLGRFEQAVSEQWPESPPRGGSDWANSPVHHLKRFIVKRAHYVRLQLDGKTRGLTLKLPAEK